MYNLYVNDYNKYKNKYKMYIFFCVYVIIKKIRREIGCKEYI